jgi:hypothetical protein
VGLDASGDTCVEGVGLRPLKQHEPEESMPSEALILHRAGRLPRLLRAPRRLGGADGGERSERDPEDDVIEVAAFFEDEPLGRDEAAALGLEIDVGDVLGELSSSALESRRSLFELWEPEPLLIEPRESAIFLIVGKHHRN